MHGQFGSERVNVSFLPCYHHMTNDAMIWLVDKLFGLSKKRNPLIDFLDSLLYIIVDVPNLSRL